MNGELIFTMVGRGLILGVIEIKVYIVRVGGVEEKKEGVEICNFFQVWVVKD
jgi:hypothetical protein